MILCQNSILTICNERCFIGKKLIVCHFQLAFLTALLIIANFYYLGWPQKN